jgi:deazaflavin-dependent oxidoreductase (nitroreductase family)
MWVKLMMMMNVVLYRLTRGGLGSKMAGQSLLLLFSIGRKSGKRYITPINYYQDGDRYLVVASNWGKANHPGWYFNLISQGRALIQVNSVKLNVRASLADGLEYDRLWTYVCGKNPFYSVYQKKVARRIPVVILTPEKS